MTISGYLFEEIRKREKNGIKPDVIKLHPDDILELRDEIDNVKRTEHGYYKPGIDEFAGVPIYPTKSVDRLEVERVCQVCSSNKLYHETEEKYFCPFCRGP